MFRIGEGKQHEYTKKPPNPCGNGGFVRCKIAEIIVEIISWRTAEHDVQPSDRIHLTLIQKDQYSCGFSGFPLSVNP